MTGVNSGLTMNKFAHTAHFPGSGPPGKQCRTCLHLVKQKCSKWTELMQATENKPRKSNPLRRPASTTNSLQTTPNMVL